MTEANRRENIREELERADRSLEAANILYDHTYSEDYENLRKEAESLAVRVRAFLRQEGHLPVE